MSLTVYKNGKDVSLAINFHLREFQCKCGKCSNTTVDSKLVDYLQRIRDHFDAPVYIHSAFRCEDWNKSVGGVYNSQHRYGKAADISVEGVPCSMVAEYAESIGVLGIGLYDEDNGDFVHIDTREYKSFWMNHTQDAVKTFQSTGIVEITDVTYMQMVLHVLGYEIAIDGIYGDETHGAVVKFQKKHGLEADGIIGIITLNKMIEEVKKV